jgi:hypothetical protein
MDDDGYVPSRSPSTTARALAPLTVVAAVFVVFAAIAVPIVLQRGSGFGFGDSRGGFRGAAEAPKPLPANAPDGVPVEGAGILLRDRGDVRLCADVVVALGLPPSSAACGAVWVPVTGVSKRWFSNKTTEGQTYSVPVRVEGSYRGGTLEVNEVQPAGPADDRASTEPAVPCTPPLGGWRPGNGFLDPDAESAATERLQTALAGGREHYTEVWEGHPAGAGPGASTPPYSVLVAGTTADLAMARAELSAVYSGNLCVHQVRFAVADLERIAQRMREAAPGRIDAQPSTIEDRVRVQVVALDPTTVALLKRFDPNAVLLEEPMLQWLD